LTSIFIDDGLMREKEPQSVRKIFKNLGVKVDVLDARDEFFAALEGQIDPRRSARRSAIRSIPFSDGRSGRAARGFSFRGRSKRTSSKPKAASRPSTISSSRSASIRTKATASR